MPGLLSARPHGVAEFLPLKGIWVSASQVALIGGNKLSQTPKLVNPNLRSTVPTGEDPASFAGESLGDPSS